MFDIGGIELLVIATVLIVVVGPKDLPGMLRTFGRTISKVKGMAAEFRGQFDDALREAELDEVRKAVDDVRSMNPKTSMREAMDPFRKAGKEVKKAIEDDDEATPFDSPITPDFDPMDDEPVMHPLPDRKDTSKAGDTPANEAPPASRNDVKGGMDVAEEERGA